LTAYLSLNTTGFDSKLRGAESSFASAAERMARMGRTMSLAVTTPLLAVGTGMVKMAMDAVESENLFTVSMGKMEGAGRQWSEELGKSLGINQYNVRKMLGTFNVMTSSMGVATDQAFTMSKGMTQLAYDMASFYNLRVDEAFEKIQAGISGEIEPLKRLGIVVNDTMVKDAAYRFGVAKTGEELTEAQKVMVRYKLIMEQTSAAQGDLARTADSPANKIRRLKEQGAELAIKFGQMVLPMLEKAVGWLQQMVKWLDEMDKGQRTTFLYLAAALIATGPVMVGLANLVTAYKTLKAAVLGANAAMALTPGAAAMGGAGAAAGGAAGGAGIGLGGRLAGGLARFGLPGVALAGLGANAYMAYKSFAPEWAPGSFASEKKGYRDKSKRAGEIADEYIKGGTHSLKYGLGEAGNTPSPDLPPNDDAEKAAERARARYYDIAKRGSDEVQKLVLERNQTLEGVTDPKERAAVIADYDDQIARKKVEVEKEQRDEAARTFTHKVGLIEQEYQAYESAQVNKLKAAGKANDAEYQGIINGYNQRLRAIAETQRTEKLTDADVATSRTAAWHEAAAQIADLNQKVTDEAKRQAKETADAQKARFLEAREAVDRIIEEQAETEKKKASGRYEIMKDLKLKMVELAFGETSARVAALDYERAERIKAINEVFDTQAERNAMIAMLDAELNGKKEQYHREELARQGKLSGYVDMPARNLFGGRRASMLALRGASMAFNPPVNAATAPQMQLQGQASPALAQQVNILLKMLSEMQQQTRKLDGMGTYRK
jgi:hypothetical protein